MLRPPLSSLLPAAQIYGIASHWFSHPTPPTAAGSSLPFFSTNLRTRSNKCDVIKWDAHLGNLPRALFNFYWNGPWPGVKCLVWESISLNLSSWSSVREKRKCPFRVLGEILLLGEELVLLFTSERRMEQKIVTHTGAMLFCHGKEGARLKLTVYQSMYNYPALPPLPLATSCGP